MPRLILHSQLKSVQAAWTSLYGDGQAFTPYQDPAYCLIVERFFRLSTKQRCRNVVCEVRDEEDRTVLLLPLHLAKLAQGVTAYLWGEFSQAGYLDVLSGPGTAAGDLRFALDALVRDHGVAEFRFSRVRAGSRLDLVLEAAFAPEEYERVVETCRHIPLPADYDTYFNGLGKGHRQKLRSAVNRLASEGLAWKVETFLGQPMPMSTQFRLFDLYWRRMTSKGINFKLRKFFPYFLRIWFNPAILALTRMPSTYYAVLYIGGSVAGFCAGFTSTSGQVTLPFLAIEGKFSRFTPGGLLLSGAIRHLIENTEYRVFDLSRGDEKYKGDYGGVAHFNHEYTIRPVRSPGPA